MFEDKYYEESIVASYTAMFHAARAILFKDGYKERSHYAVYEYLQEKYSEKIPQTILYELNTLRTQRHHAMYDIEERIEIKETEADSAIKTAKKFLRSIKSIIYS